MESIGMLFAGIAIGLLISTLFHGNRDIVVIRTSEGERIADVFTLDEKKPLETKFEPMTEDEYNQYCVDTYDGSTQKKYAEYLNDWRE